MVFSSRDKIKRSSPSSSLQLKFRADFKPSLKKFHTISEGLHFFVIGLSGKITIQFFKMYGESWPKINWNRYREKVPSPRTLQPLAFAKENLQTLESESTRGLKNRIILFL